MHQQVGPAGDVCILGDLLGRLVDGILVVLSIFAMVASETMVTKANMKIDSDRMASTVNEPFSPLSFTVSPSHGFFITPPF